MVASASVAPSSHACASAAMNASPAPVGSTTIGGNGRDVAAAHAVGPQRAFGAELEHDRLRPEGVQRIDGGLALGAVAHRLTGHQLDLDRGWPTADRRR